MEYEGEYFYRTILQVKRQSDQCDFIPLLLSERLLDDTKDYEGQSVCVTGQFRSYNSHGKEKVHLILHVFVKELDILDSDEEAGKIGRASCRERV